LMEFFARVAGRNCIELPRPKGRGFFDLSGVQTRFLRPHQDQTSILSDRYPRQLVLVCSGLSW
jgi:hypothetical protein